MPMLEEVLDWWKFNFWFDASCLVAGIVVVLPLLLSRTFRKWFDRSDIDLEFIGLVALVLAGATIGLYNYLGRSSGT